MKQLKLRAKWLEYSKGPINIDYCFQVLSQSNLWIAPLTILIRELKLQVI